MSFQFRGWSDKMFRKLVYIAVAIIIFVALMWIFDVQWEIWRF